MPPIHPVTVLDEVQSWIKYNASYEIVILFVCNYFVGKVTRLKEQMTKVWLNRIKMAKAKKGEKCGVKKKNEKTNLKKETILWEEVKRHWNIFMLTVVGKNQKVRQHEWRGQNDEVRK